MNTYHLQLSADRHLSLIRTVTMASNLLPQPHDMDDLRIAVLSASGVSSAHAYFGACGDWDSGV